MGRTSLSPKKVLALGTFTFLKKIKVNCSLLLKTYLIDYNRHCNLIVTILIMFLLQVIVILYK